MTIDSLALSVKQWNPLASRRKQQKQDYISQGDPLLIPAPRTWGIDLPTRRPPLYPVIDNETNRMNYVQGLLDYMQQRIRRDQECVDREQSIQAQKRKGYMLTQHTDVPTNGE